MTIRAFEPGDIPGVIALWAACEGLGNGPGDAPEPLARYLARNPGLPLVAEVEGVIVGAVLCGHDGRRGMIYRLAVAKEHRRKGIARALVVRGLAGLRGEGIERCMLLAVGANAGARAFWESVGATWRERLVLYTIDL